MRDDQLEQIVIELKRLAKAHERRNELLEEMEVNSERRFQDSRRDIRVSTGSMGELSQSLNDFCDKQVEAHAELAKAEAEAQEALKMAE